MDIRDVHGEMDNWVKYLLCMHEDLTLSPQNFVKLDKYCLSVIAVFQWQDGKWRHVNPQKLSGPASLIARDHVSINMRGVVRCWRLSFDFHMYKVLCTSMSKHIHHKTHTYIDLINKSILTNKSVGLGNCSAVKSFCCSSRGPELGY